MDKHWMTNILKKIKKLRDTATWADSCGYERVKIYCKLAEDYLNARMLESIEPDKEYDDADDD